MIRFIAVVIFVVLFLILSTPLMLIEWFMKKHNKAWHDTSSLAIVNWGFRVVIRLCGTKVIVKGEENIPLDTPVLYVANHRSLLDIILTYVRAVGPTGFIAKKELGKVPLLNIWMNHLYCLFLDRKDIKAGMKTILTAIEYAKSGISVFIFPEGTRNKQNDGLLPFHEGSFKVAEKAGIPVVPVTLVNTSAIFEDQFPRIKKATVIIEYGKPIHLNELEKEQRKHVGAYTQGIIEETYHKNKAELAGL